VTHKLRFIQRHAVKQPSPGYCGPIALRNALLRYERIDPDRVIQACRPSRRHGCDEHALARGARRLGYRIEPFNCTTPAFCRSQIRWWIRRNVPALLCVDRDSTGHWAHWITVIHATARHAYICDSSNDAPPDPQRLPWSQFLARAVTITHLTPQFRNDRFDLYGVLQV
jgi:hypothetical protein